MFHTAIVLIQTKHYYSVKHTTSPLLLSWLQSIIQFCLINLLDRYRWCAAISSFPITSEASRGSHPTPGAVLPSWIFIETMIPDINYVNIYCVLSFEYLKGNPY